MGKYSVSLKKVVDDNSLGVLYAPKPVEDVYVTSYDVNRPGLMLAGYSAYFDAERLQFLGLTDRRGEYGAPHGNSARRRRYHALARVPR